MRSLTDGGPNGRAGSRLGPGRLRLVVGGILLAAILGAVMGAAWLMGAPEGDVRLLALFLFTSGGLSLLIGGAAIRWTGGQVQSIRVRLAAAYAVGLLVALANVFTTSALMFLSPHDLALLTLLLVFSAVVSFTFIYAVASTLTGGLDVLSRTAAHLAEGDLDARVHASGSDEIARVGAAFDHMADQLQQAFQQQKALEDSRRELIGAVSHDLRTPLATTRAMVEALTDRVVTEPSEVRRYLTLVGHEIQHMSNLIGELLELSRIESGSVHLHRMPLQAGELLVETVTPFGARAKSAGIALSLILPALLPVLNADAQSLQRVLRNLLDNALQHTPPGGTIVVEAWSPGATLDVSVSDSGSGIPNEERERVFERFYTRERSRHREGGGDGRASSGSGLGLAIARGLIEAHHGRLWAEPSPLGGARLHVELPLARPE